MTTANDYARVTDFRTGEVTSTWTDSYGTWTRRAFVSRADKVIVHELIARARPDDRHHAERQHRARRRARLASGFTTLATSATAPAT